MNNAAINVNMAIQWRTCLKITTLLWLIPTFQVFYIIGLEIPKRRSSDFLSLNPLGLAQAQKVFVG